MTFRKKPAVKNPASQFDTCKLIDYDETDVLFRYGALTMNEVSVRYIVNKVDEAIPFYTEMLGFNVDMHPAPGFASLSRGGLRLLLNQPGAGGAGQDMPDGRRPAPGGWNRIQVEVDDLDVVVGQLRQAGYALRSEIITGNGGKQIIVDDPSGNPIELFQPFER
jgi:catechol 2,3-dioxygenase-like lactoylglutathione lyase family enzyme